MRLLKYNGPGEVSILGVGTFTTDTVLEAPDEVVRSFEGEAGWEVVAPLKMRKEREISGL